MKNCLHSNYGTFRRVVPEKVTKNDMLKTFVIVYDKKYSNLNSTEKRVYGNNLLQTGRLIPNMTQTTKDCNRCCCFEPEGKQISSYLRNVVDAVIHWKSCILIQNMI